MGGTELVLRIAEDDDIEFVCSVIDEVSEGVLETLFGGLVPGKTSAQMLSFAFAKGIQPYVADNVIVAENESGIVGICFAYDAKNQQMAKVAETFLGQSRIDPVRQLLTAGCPGALWVNTIWTHPSVRGRGLGELLLKAAEQLAKEQGLRSLALHCWADNASALRFYENIGFREKGAIEFAGRIRERHPKGGILLEKDLKEKS